MMNHQGVDNKRRRMIRDGTTAWPIKSLRISTQDLLVGHLCRMLTQRLPGKLVTPLVRIGTMETIDKVLAFRIMDNMGSGTRQTRVVLFSRDRIFPGHPLERTSRAMVGNPMLLMVTT
jgi:hypothetical protein